MSRNWLGWRPSCAGILIRLQASWSPASDDRRSRCPRAPHASGRLGVIPCPSSWHDSSFSSSTDGEPTALCVLIAHDSIVGWTRRYVLFHRHVLNRGGRGVRSPLDANF